MSKQIDDCAEQSEACLEEGELVILKGQVRTRTFRFVQADTMWHTLHRVVTRWRSFRPIDWRRRRPANLARHPTSATMVSTTTSRTSGHPLSARR